LPYADFSGFELSNYSGKTIHSCRGCVRRCVFCSDWRQKKYRQMRAERIFGEIEHQCGTHPDATRFLFGDSLLNGDMKALASFRDLLLHSGLSVSWKGWAIVRPEMTPEFLAKMRAAGCDELFYGIETGSEKVMRALDKHVPVALNGAVLKATREAGIATISGFIVGFPAETEDDFQQSLDFLRENAASISLLNPTLFHVYEMMDRSDDYGLEPTGSPHYWRTRDGTNTFPIRVDRMRRLVKTARSSGISVSAEALDSSDRIDAECDQLLADYERWLTRTCPPIAI
ncbi:MAG: B12-binding domain-containing radical SAM protein, partial [Elusimicrobiota bacterium]